MANDTTSNPPNDTFEKKGPSAIIVLLPSLFVLLLIVFLTIVCLLPRSSRSSDEAKAECQQERLRRLDSNIKAELFVDWAKGEQESHPDASFSTILCVICLEDFVDASHIRALACNHVFHQECVDKWFARWNEYCPLCHRPIVPREKKSPKHRRWDEPPSVALII